MEDVGKIVADVIDQAGSKVREDVDGYRRLLGKLAKDSSLSAADQAELSRIVRDSAPGADLANRLRADAAVIAEFAKCEAEAAELGDAIDAHRLAAEEAERFARGEYVRLLAVANGQRLSLDGAARAAAEAVRRAQDFALRLVALWREHAELFGPLGDEQAANIRTGHHARQFRHRFAVPECLRIALGGRADNPVFAGADGLAPEPVAADTAGPVGPAIYELAPELPAPERE